MIPKEILRDVSFWSRFRAQLIKVKGKRKEQEQMQKHLGLKTTTTETKKKGEDIKKIFRP